MAGLQNLVGAYINALELHRIFVAGSAPAGPVKIGAGEIGGSQIDAS